MVVFMQLWHAKRMLRMARLQTVIMGRLHDTANCTITKTSFLDMANVG